MKRILLLITLALMAGPSLAGSYKDICLGQSACRTQAVARNSGDRRFIIFGRFYFNPPKVWQRLYVQERDDAKMVSFLYKSPPLPPRGEPGFYCSLSVYKFDQDVGPKFDFLWDVMVKNIYEKKGARLVALDTTGGGPRRAAIYQERDGLTQNIELRIVGHHVVISERDIPRTVKSFNYYPLGAALCDARPL